MEVRFPILMKFSADMDVFDISVCGNVLELLKSVFFTYIALGVC